MKKNITILYVEDEDEIRQNTTRPLHRLCSELFIASNGKEGLELYKKHKPDIVISDIKMPNMDGIDMCKAIKDIDSEQHIIFTTAHSDSNYFMEAIEMQVDGYILKPIEYNLLENKINTIINQVIIKNRLNEQKILCNEVTRFQNNLLFVLDDTKEVIFANEKFLEFFSIKDFEEFNEVYKDIGTLFIKNSGCFYPKKARYWLDDLKQTKDEKRRVVAIEDNKNNLRVFVIAFNEVCETSHNVFILTEITNLNNEKNSLKENVYLDALTRIPNRLYIDKQFITEIAKKHRKNTPLSLIILDIDKFKNFNDTYGHLIGDKILFGLSKYIVENKRKIDIFGRWGGEEFMMLLPSTSLDGAKVVAEKFRKLIEQHVFFNDLKLTCSFGIAEFTEYDSKESFIKRADDLLYIAKKNGRNRVEF